MSIPDASDLSPIPDGTDLEGCAPGNTELKRWSAPRVILSVIGRNTAGGPYAYFYEGHLTSSGRPHDDQPP